MYLYTATLRKIDHLTLEEAKRMAMDERGKGRRSEIISDDEAQRRGLRSSMQDLTRIEDWDQVD